MKKTLEDLFRDVYMGMLAYRKNAPAAWIQVRNFKPTIYHRNSPYERIDHSMALLEEMSTEKRLPEHVDFLMFVEDNVPDDIVKKLIEGEYPRIMTYYDGQRVFCPIPSTPLLNFGIGPPDYSVMRLDEWTSMLTRECDIPYESRMDELFYIGGSLPYRHSVAQRIRNIPGVTIQIGWSPQTFVQLHKQTGYKYLMDMNGLGWSGRLMHLLWMGSVVFILDRLNHEFWFRENFKPWVHYVPVSNDARDFQEVFDRIRTSHDKGKSIADACRIRAREVLTEAFFKESYETILKKYQDETKCP